MTPGCASGFAETHNSSTLVQLNRELRRINELLSKVPDPPASRDSR